MIIGSYQPLLMFRAIALTLRARLRFAQPPRLRKAGSNILAMVVLAGLSFMAVSCGSPGQTRADDKPSVRAHIEVIQLSTVTDHFEAPGTIQARTKTILSSKVVGQILSLTVREGDRVRQGQVVAEIEGRDASAQLRRAKAAVTEAQQALEEADRGVQGAEAAVRVAEANRDLALSTRKRYDILQERHSVSPQEYDEIDSRYRTAGMETERGQQALAAAKARRLQVLSRIEQAEAEVDAAQVAIGYSRIVSPIDGIVTARQAEPGMLATPGAPLLAVEDDRTYELEAAVEESRTANIAVGQKARVEIDALHGSAIDGSVSEIVPASDPATRTYIVKIHLAQSPASAHGMRSGFFGKALFGAGDRKALIIPQSALIHRGQLDGVFIVENDNVAVLRLVKLGKQYDQGVEVLSGLEPGARVLTTPAAEVSDGVRIIDAEPARKTP